jgi:small subunit ribosomal protein S13
MIYLLETELKNNKSILFAIKLIYGIGRSTSLKICKQLGFSSNFKIYNLSNEQTLKLLKLIEESNLVINNDLKTLQSSFIKNLINIKTYRGIRRLNGLPVRGQRTHTNAKTARRNKKVIFY